MTQDLFRTDAYLAECTATVTAITDQGIVLDRTVFYPLGGGQAGDAGALVLADGRALPIADTRKGKDAEGQFTNDICHLPAPDGHSSLSIQDFCQQHGLQVGDTVTARIDWARRHRLMRFHTTTHLLCHLVPQLVNGCSITPDYARLDFNMTDPLDKDALTAGIAALVAAAHPVTVGSITDAELDANPALVKSMSVQPPRGSGTIRTIRIGGHRADRLPALRRHACGQHRGNRRGGRDQDRKEIAPPRAVWCWVSPPDASRAGQPARTSADFMQHRNITGDSFFCWDGDILIVNILGKPSARTDAIGEPQGNQLRSASRPSPRTAGPPTTWCKFPGAAVRRARDRHRGGVRPGKREQAAAHQGAPKIARRVRGRTAARRGRPGRTPPRPLSTPAAAGPASGDNGSCRARPGSGGCCRGTKSDPTHSHGLSPSITHDSIPSAAHSLSCFDSDSRLGPFDAGMGSKFFQNRRHDAQVRAELLAFAPQGVPVGLGEAAAARQPVWVGPATRAQARVAHLLEELRRLRPADHARMDAAAGRDRPATLPGRLPKKIPIGTLANYGYEGTVLLPVPLTITPDFKPP